MWDEYVSVDLEMTGLQTASDSIIEIGALKVTKEGREEFPSLIKPTKPIPEKVEKLTGITNEMVEDAPDPSEVLRKFLEWAGDYPLLAHHVSTDYAFLKQWAVNEKLSYERDGIDTLKIARRLRPELSSHSLDAMLSFYEIPIENHHRALDDAICTAELFEAMKGDLRNEDLTEAEREKLYTPYALRYSAKRKTPATASQVRYLQRFCEYHKIPFPEEVRTLTRSEVSRMTDRYITQYGRMKTE